MRLRRLLWLALAGGCGPEPELAQAVLALGEPPLRVAEVSVQVRELSDERVVFSATVAPSVRSLALGLPVERPLEFRAVARTRVPSPRPEVGLPAFVARSVRSVPLDREPYPVSLSLKPAGLLVLHADDDVELEAAGPLGTPPYTFRLIRGQMVGEVFEAGFVRLVASDPDRELVPSGPFFVAAERAARSRLRTRPRTPIGQRLHLAIEPNDTARVLPLGPFALRARFEDASGAPLEVRAPIALGIRVVPPEALRVPDSGTLVAGEALTGFEVRAPGRVEFFLTADGPDERHWTAFRALNLVQPAAGATELGFALTEPSRLAEGTELLLFALDSAGRFAALPGPVDFAPSDPWVAIAARPSERSEVAQFHLQVPSEPIGTPVFVRATVTSSLGEQALELVLPPAHENPDP